MRLFTGVALAPGVVDRISALLSELRPTARVNWSPVENLHITLRFIGEWPEERLSGLTAALGTVPVTQPVPIGISQFGFFPNPHHPHSFFAGVHAGPGLAELSATIERSLTPLGLAPEARIYHPHVTLARVKRSRDIRGLREHIAGMTDYDFGSFDAASFHLYRSAPGTRGSVYTKLATYDLMRERSAIS